MKNKIVGTRARKDIDEQVGKILSGLGNPEPPIILEEVRELLLLDREYYSSEDYSTVGEIVSKVKIAGKQIIKRPALLVDAIKKANIKALWLPDKKRILIDKDQPILKHRWNEAHEIGHSIIPWHNGALFGDNEFSLNPSCQEQLEAEANFTAGQILFMGSKFSDLANDSQPTFKDIKTLHKIFGNTITSTLWRFVEESHDQLPMVGVVSVHPKYLGADFDPNNPCRHFIQSPTFKEKFSNVTDTQVFNGISLYCSDKKSGPVGQGELVFLDDNGEEHNFFFDSFSNSYNVLTLGIYNGPHKTTVAQNIF